MHARYNLWGTSYIVRDQPRTVAKVYFVIFFPYEHRVLRHRSLLHWRSCPADISAPLAVQRTTSKYGVINTPEVRCGCVPYRLPDIWQNAFKYCENSVQECGAKTGLEVITHYQVQVTIKTNLLAEKARTRVSFVA